MVTEVNVPEGDLKIEFLHLNGSRKTFSWPSAADKCFVPVSNILCVITAPTTATGRMYQISHTGFEQTLKAVVHIWSFLSLGTNALFFFQIPGYT